MDRFASFLLTRDVTPATAMSGPSRWGTLRGPPTPPRFRVVRAGAAVVARGSLVALLAMSSTGCLITSTPTFQEQKHTAPFLIPSTAQPDLRLVKIVADGDTTVTFSAEVVSQDDPADGTGVFKNVQSRLYIDYGTTVPGSAQPYFDVIGGTTLSAGTVDQTSGRQVTVVWPTQSPPVTYGCHTATLVVSHLFDAVPQCPACEDDFTMLTWQVLRCGASQSCDALPLTEDGACAVQSNPLQATSCEAVHAAHGSSCPSTADGGTP